MTQKTEVQGIVKVGEGVFLNTDNNSLRAYKKRKEQANRVNALEQTVDEIKSDMKEIKELLKGLVK